MHGSVALIECCSYIALAHTTTAHMLQHFTVCASKWHSEMVHLIQAVSPGVGCTDDRAGGVTDVACTAAKPDAVIQPGKLADGNKVRPKPGDVVHVRKHHVVGLHVAAAKDRHGRPICRVNTEAIVPEFQQVGD